MTRPTVLIVGAAPTEDPFLPTLIGVIESADVVVEVDQGFERLTTAGLAGIDTLIVAGGPRRSSEATEAQLRDLIAHVLGGASLVALRRAAVPFEAQARYLGPSNGPQTSARGVHRVAVHTPAHPITTGVDDFDIEDQFDLLVGDVARMSILATSGGHPVLHTQRWGFGRVHFNGLGNLPMAIDHPAYQQLVRQAIRWAVTAREARPA